MLSLNRFLSRQTFRHNFHLAYRNITRSKRRSILSIGAVTFGVAALMLAGGFINWILLEFRETTINSQLGHLQIVRPGYHNVGKADPYAFLLPNTLPKEIASHHNEANILIVTPRLSLSGLVSYGEATISFIGDAVDPREQTFFGNALKILAGSNLSIDRPNHIIMGEGLARNLGVMVDNRVVLLVNTTSGGINAIEVTVGGLFSTVTKSYDDSAIRLPISSAQKLLRTEGTHSWIVLLNDTGQTDHVLTKLRNTLPTDKFEVVPWYVLADFYNKTVVLFSKQVMGIKVIIAAIILLSIFNTMSINVMERIGEIGTAMALGVKRTSIMQLFLSEGMMIGCIGGLIGITVGLLFANIISYIGISMPSPPGMSHGYTGEILVTFEIAIESLLLAVTTTTFASIYPAWKASRMQIVDALRRNR